MSKIIEIQKSQPHPRIFIRRAFKQILIDNTDLAGKWFCSRPSEIWLNEIPCGLIYFQDEVSDFGTRAPREYDKELTIVNDILHRGETDSDEGLDDYLDSRAFEVEWAILCTKNLGLSSDLVKDIVLVRTQPITIQKEGDRDIAGIRITWSVSYTPGLYSVDSYNEFLKFTNSIEFGSETAKDSVTIRSA